MRVLPPPGCFRALVVVVTCLVGLLGTAVAVVVAAAG